MYLQVSVITFGHPTYSHIILTFANGGNGKTKVGKFIRKIEQLKGNQPSYTFTAISKLFPTAFSTSNGARANAKRLAIVFTDGLSTDAKVEKNTYVTFHFLLVCANSICPLEI